ncbi:MAG: transketolase-like TK C-terminal-containing protein [Metamycoplasmataceae bacterium]
MNLNDKKNINAIRFLGLKAIREAGGGHIGMTISAAPILYTLYTKFMRISPTNGKWINRDRFILSAGHGAMSLYPILHFSGLLSLEEIKKFKKEGSLTPGHPEYENKLNNFIDASTGPLGQGFAMAVGMAIAQKQLENLAAAPVKDMFDHFTYAVIGDGDLQEGISYESASIAGRLGLNKLIVLHDSNRFQLDSDVSLVFNEDLQKRFESTNWYYQKVSNNPVDIQNAILNAQQSSKPSFIEVSTIIAESTKFQDSNKGHHGMVDDEMLESFNKYFDSNFEKKTWIFEKDIYDHFKNNVYSRGEIEYQNWVKKCSIYKNNFRAEFSSIQKIIANSFDFSQIFNIDNIFQENLSTREYFKKYMEGIDSKIPNILSLNADISSSTNIKTGNNSFVHGGKNVDLGIREFAMAAISNGINLHGGLKVISGTFLVFADYMKSAIRLGAMMKIPNIFLFSHDSYLIGGDGPTHQAYDQLPMLRAIENVHVHRPMNQAELRLALIEAFDSKEITNIIILSRQNIETNLGQSGTTFSHKQTENSAYAINDIYKPDFVIAASGSEVALALQIAKQVKNLKVVSVPCLDKATELSIDEKNSLFEAKKALITIEASSDYKWLLFNKKNQINLHIGAFTFGESMDGNDLYSKKGFDAHKIANYLNKSFK